MFAAALFLTNHTLSVENNVLYGKGLIYAGKQIYMDRYFQPPSFLLTWNNLEMIRA